MANAEVGLNPNGVENVWEGIQYPPNPSEQEKRHESIITRIGRIVTEKAAEIVNYFKKKREARIEAVREAEHEYNEQHVEQEQAARLDYDMRYLSTKDPQEREELERKISEDDFSRLKFIEENLDIFQNCPSTGRNLSLNEAFELCDEYAEYVTTLEGERAPKSRYSTLIEMEEMLEQKIEEAEQSSNEQALEDYRRKYDMVQDLESMMTIAYDYENISDAGYFGSKLMIRRYIRERIEKEGYRGDQEMRDRKPPYVGGALGVEATLGMIHVLDGDEPLSEIYDNIDFNTEGNIDWEAVEQFSPRGRELKLYRDGLHAAKKKREQRNKCRENAEKLRHAAEELRSDAEIQDLSKGVQEAIEAERISQIISGYNGLLNANLQKIEALRGGAELNPDLQGELSKKGLTREDYARELEDKNNKIKETISNFSNGVFTEGQRAIIEAHQISRTDLAKRLEGRADEYMQHRRTLHQDFRQFGQMYERSNGDFTRDVLRAGLEDAPELPEEVVDYLCRNYKYDSSANGVGLRLNTYGQKKLQLEYIIADINRRVVWLKDTARFCNRKFGSMSCDLEDQVYMNPGVREMSGPLEAASDLLEDYPAGTYLKESDFLTEQVIPSIKAIIKAIDDKIATTNEQPAFELLPVA